MQLLSLLLAFLQLSGGLMFPGPGMTSSPPVLPPSGMNVWYSADCITYTSSVCGVPANNSTVTSWADRSGNANNLTSTGGTSTFLTAQLNGKPAVTFSSSKFSLTAFIPRGNRTLFAVFRSTSGSTEGDLIGGATGAFAYGFGTTQLVIVSACQTFGGAGTGSLGSTWHQANVAHNYSVNLTFRLDRAADGVVSLASGSGNDSTTVGYTSCNNSEFFAGQLTELINYPSVLSNAQITQVETYLNNKYGL